MTSVPRTICVITGSRADYGLLFWLLKEIQQDPGFRLQIIATGMHCSAEFGNTYQQIEQDGFHIDRKIDIHLQDDSPLGIAKSMGIAIPALLSALQDLHPDIVVVLGDRFEILAAAQSALLARYPLAHIHGGEETTGAIDNQMRHAVSKIAQLHFPVTERYRQRLIQMGENPKHIYCFGAPGLDHLIRTPFLNQASLEAQLGIQFSAVNLVVTYHPVTLQANPAAGIDELLQALDRFSEASIIFTRSNADEGGREINAAIDAFVAQQPQRRYAFTALGLQRYMSLVKIADVVVGNSSSGIYEAPLLGTPTVNIGERQNGRFMPLSVIHCEADQHGIEQAIHQALSAEWRQSIINFSSPYGDGDACVKIKDCLKHVNLDGLVKKCFHEACLEVVNE